MLAYRVTPPGRKHLKLNIYQMLLFVLRTKQGKSSTVFTTAFKTRNHTFISVTMT